MKDILYIKFHKNSIYMIYESTIKIYNNKILSNVIK